MDKDQLLDELRNFYGTEHYYHTNPGLLVTELLEWVERMKSLGGTAKVKVV